jgi:3-oxoacyl-[acyl-carrier protein] reductase
MTMSNSRAPGRTALVTGASRGIGAAVAVALARRGITPVLAVRDPASAARAAQAVQAQGQSALVVPCDVADYASVKAAVQATLDRWGRLDAVVNNAGQIEPIGHLADTDPAAWARTVAVNLVGCYHVAHAAMASLLQGQGTLVNVSTGAAYTPREGWSAYCSSKAGLTMLTRSLHLEYHARGLSAYGLQPGLVATRMQDTIRASGMNEISRVPRERLAPADLSAGVIAWLVDTRPQDLLGQDLTVNDEVLMKRVV